MVGGKFPAAGIDQLFERGQRVLHTIKHELFLHQRGIGEHMALALGQGAAASVIGAGDDTVAAFKVDILADLDAVPNLRGQAAEPALALVAIDIAAEDIESKMADEIELGAAMRDFRRQQAVVAMVGEPLPVVRRVNDAVGMAALQHPPDLDRGCCGIGPEGDDQKRGEEGKQEGQERQRHLADARPRNAARDEQRDADRRTALADGQREHQVA